MTDAKRIESFWRRVEKTPDCWIWKGARQGSEDCYGAIRISGHLVSAHAFSYSTFVKYLKKGYGEHNQIHHICRNTLCVRPSHLELISRSQHKTEHYQPKTHCNRGHFLSEDNYWTNSYGYRVCKTCDRLRRNATKDRANLAR